MTDIIYSATLRKEKVMEVKSVDFHITGLCGLKCRHCLIDSPHMNENDLTVGEIDSLASQMRKIGVDFVYITGGEPFYRADIVEVLTCVKDRKIGIRLATSSVFANPNFKKEDLIEFISSLDTNNLWLGISIEGSRNLNDTIRGEGSFDSAVALAKLAVKNRINSGFMATISRVNLNETTAIIELGQKLGVDNVVFLYFAPFGRGMQMKNNLLLLEEWARFKEDIEYIRYTTPFEVQIERVFAINDNEIGNYSCKAIKGETLCIMPDGDVYPCILLIKPEFKVGNIRKSELDKIWFESKRIVANAWQKARRYKVCSGHCSGGCLGFMLNNSSSGGSCDPRCLGVGNIRPICPLYFDGEI